MSVNLISDLTRRGNLHEQRHGVFFIEMFVVFLKSSFESLMHSLSRYS